MPYQYLIWPYVLNRKKKTWSYSFQSSLGWSVPTGALIILFQLETFINLCETATGSSKTSLSQDFGLRWNQCNLSSKTSTDHQLSLSAIYISSASAVHQGETPQRTSGAITIRILFAVYNCLIAPKLDSGKSTDSPSSGALLISNHCGCAFVQKLHVVKLWHCK